MEDDNSQKQTTETSTSEEQVILSEEQKESEHVYEQQISKASNNDDKEMSASASGGDTSTNETNQPAAEEPKEQTDSEHVYEQQISKASTNSDKEMSASASGGDTSTNETNQPAAEEPKEQKDSGVEKEAEKEQEGEGRGLKAGVEAKDGGTIGDYEEYRHDSPAEIRRHQLENMNPDPDHSHVSHLIMSVHGGHIHDYGKVQPESFLWLSIFTLIFFSRIFGAIALYKSIKVRLLFAEGHLPESEAASNAAKKWNLVGMIFCACWVILIVVLFKSSGLFEAV